MQGNHLFPAENEGHGASDSSGGAIASGIKFAK